MYLYWMEKINHEAMYSINGQMFDLGFVVSVLFDTRDIENLCQTNVAIQPDKKCDHTD
jgi:hypothetical protein